MKKELKDTFESKHWTVEGEDFPRSGPGSRLSTTEQIRDALPGLFQQLNIKRFIDAPCGDWNWMQTVDLSGIDYLGFDISGEVIDSNIAQFSGEGVSFAVLDITSDPLPDGDLMMVRDCLFHLQFKHRWDFFRNFLETQTPYLLTTSYFNLANDDLPRNGAYRRFNMTAPPFNFPEPSFSVLETDAPKPDDFKAWARTHHRRMGLWHRDQIASALHSAKVL